MKHFIYRFLLILLICLTTNLQTFAKDIRFVQVTDFHHFDDVESQEREVALIKDLNSIKNLDFIVFTGDNIDVANPVTLVRFLRPLKELKTPYYVMVGNHDAVKYGGLSKKLYGRIIKKLNKNQKTTNTNFAFKYNDVVFVCLDGAREVIPSPNGYYREDTLKWLDKILAKNQDKNVVLFQHFPSYITGTNHDTYKVENYKNVIYRYGNVKATFSGHMHRNLEYDENGTHHVLTGPAHGNTPEYKIVDMVQEKNSETGKKEYKFYTQSIYFTEKN